jgi:hypothetical protein
VPLQGGQRRMLLNYAASLRLPPVQLRFRRRRAIRPKGSRTGAPIQLHCRGPGAAKTNEATSLNLFPYMGLLDSNCAQQDYCLRSFSRQWREARSMLILNSRQMWANGAYL